MSLLAVTITTISVFIKFFILILTGIYCARILWKHIWLRDQHALVAFSHQVKRGWQIKLRAEVYSAQLLGNSTVTRFVSILRFGVPNKRLAITAIVFNDALKAGEYERLMLIAKFSNDQRDGVSQSHQLQQT